MLKKLIAAASLAIACAPLTSHAIPVLDQSFGPGAPGIAARIGIINSPTLSFQVFQSFTVGVSGIFDRLEIFVDQRGAPTENLIVEIVSGATPTGSALASMIVAPGAIPTTPSFLGIDFSAAALGVSAGDFLGFRLSSMQNFVGNINEYRAYGNGSGGYAGGSGRHICSGCTDQGWDFYFRTYVDNDAVPVSEPGVLALLAFGLFSLAAVRRHRAS